MKTQEQVIAEQLHWYNQSAYPGPDIVCVAK